MATLDRQKAWEFLLVEDDSSDARIILSALRGNPNLKVRVVSDGERAIEYLHRHGQYANDPKPDVILLDLKLPRKDGWEVLAEVRANPLLKHIPVVILSTSYSDRDILQAYSLSANAFLVKPTDLDSFVETLNVTLKFWLTAATLPRIDQTTWFL